MGRWGSPDAYCAEDKSLAGRIQEAAKLLSLEFTDFVIVGASGYFSFVEKGLMPNGPGR